MNTYSLPKRLIIATLALLAVSMQSLSMITHAETIAPQLVISQFKITSSNGQFFTLYNTTSQTLDMTKFQLEYFNNFDISKSTSSRFISLSGSLPAHSYYVVSDATLVVCYQQIVTAISLGLSSTAGMIEVLNSAQTTPGGSVVPSLQDYVGWSKTAASGAQTLPASTNASLQRLPVDTKNSPNVQSPGSGSWQAVQPDPVSACKLTTVTLSGSAGSSITPDSAQLKLGIEPAATVISVDDRSQITTDQPTTNLGLVSPMITEILPNPTGSGTDDTEEFIEIYNPNDSVFDLKGFSLRSGTSALHTVKFADDTSLAPKSFAAFYAKDMNLSLSNSGGQVVMLDAPGAVIGQSDVYEMAKDGQSWALGGGTWQWSTTPTPGLANVINKPAAPAKKASANHLKVTGKVTPTIVKTKSPFLAHKATTIKPANSFATAPPKTPIHSTVLALIAGGAILYGIYEYRSDLGNKLYELRRYLATRRAHRV